MSQLLAVRLFLTEIDDSIESLKDYIDGNQRAFDAGRLPETVYLANSALLNQEIRVLGEIRADVAGIPEAALSRDGAFGVLERLVERLPAEYGEEGAVQRLLTRKLEKIKNYIAADRCE